MAKMTKVIEGDILKCTIDGIGVASLNIAGLAPNVVRKALEFGLQTLARNATAGLMATDEDAKTGFARVQARFAAWAKGEWRVDGGAESAERPSSLLAQAIAEVIGKTPAEAAQIVADMISENVSAAGLSPDEEGDAKKIREIANEVRKTLSADSAVAVILARLRTEAAKKREAEVAAKAQAPDAKPSALAAYIQR